MIDRQAFYDMLIKEGYRRVEIMEKLGVKRWTPRCENLYVFCKSMGVDPDDVGIDRGWEWLSYNPKRSMIIGWERLDRRNKIPIIAFILGDDESSGLFSSRKASQEDDVPF